VRHVVEVSVGEDVLQNDDQGRDTEKGKGREIIQNTFPERDDEEITRPAPSRGYGRGR